MDSRVKAVYLAMLAEYQIPVNYSFQDIQFSGKEEFAKWILKVLRKEKQQWHRVKTR
jgi:hypothetical protein